MPHPHQKLPPRPELRRRTGPLRHPATRAAGLLLTGGLLGGAGVLALSPHSSPVVVAAIPAAVAATPAPAVPQAPDVPPVAQLRPAAGSLPAEQVDTPSTAPPASVDIPTIRTHSDLVDLHLEADGTLQAPPDYGVAGWYSDGAVPGDAGAPAVILGHVDSKTGPAIFYRLPSLKAGDPVLVNRTDGTQLRFEVYAVADFSKDDFPADSVYAAQPQPELRLITCSGDFDRRTGHYRSNHVVFAHVAPAAPVPVPAPVPAAPTPAPPGPAAPSPAAPPGPAAPSPAAPSPAAPSPAAPVAGDNAEAQRVLTQFANSTDLAERRTLLQRYAALTGRPGPG